MPQALEYLAIANETANGAAVLLAQIQFYVVSTIIIVMFINLKVTLLEMFH